MNIYRCLLKSGSNANQKKQICIVLTSNNNPNGINLNNFNEVANYFKEVAFKTVTDDKDFYTSNGKIARFKIEIYNHTGQCKAIYTCSGNGVYLTQHEM